MTTAGNAEGDSARAGAVVAAQAPSRRPVIRRALQVVLGKPRPGESDTRFGVRLALYGPIAFYVLFAAGLVILRVDGESGLGLTLMYWLFIGASQLVYLIPAIAAALLAKRRGVAWGMVRGAGIIAAVNGVAWLIGYYVIGVQ